MGCTASSAAAVSADPGNKTLKRNATANSDVSAASEDADKDVRRRRLSVTGGPSGDKVLGPAEGSRRRRLSIAAHPREAAEKIAKENEDSNRRGSVAKDEGMEGTQAEKLPVRYATLSRPGNDPMKRVKENQDSFVVLDRFGNDPEQMFFGVWDGHGANGAYASQYVRDNLPQAMLDPKLATDPFVAMNHACITTNQALAVSSSADVYVSGSTSITAFLRRNELFVANVGDSRAVMGRLSRSGKIKALDLSTDHKPDRPDEMARIIAAGGRVFEWGVSRVWLQDIDIPGLAMSRSFGDLAAKTVGVFAEPEMTTVKITSRDKFLILASDGVWEFIESQEAVELVHKHYSKGPSAVAAELVKESTKRWNTREDVVDDTTCVVVFLNYEDEE